MFIHAMHNRDVDLMTVQNVPSPGRASKSMEEVEMVRHRLAELSHMLCKGELTDVSDTYYYLLHLLLVVRTPQSCPYCRHYGLSTDHQHRHS